MALEEGRHRPHEGTAEAGACEPAQGETFRDFRWLIPLLNVWNPEIRTLAPRKHGLLPYTVSCNPNVAREEESEDDRGLGGKERESSI